MIRIATAVLLCGAAASFAGAQNLVGNWQGKLTAGGTELRLVLHLTEGSDGALSAALDSIDQGVKGIPAQVHQDGAKIHLDVPSVHGTYDATVGDDGKALKGTWVQQQPIPLDLEKTDHPWSLDIVPSTPSDIDGRFEGKLDVGSQKLRIDFRFTNTQSGLTATVQSPDQSQNEMRVTSVDRKDSAITIEMKQLGASFAATISADHNSIAGTFTQNGNSLPLTVTRIQE